MFCIPSTTALSFLMTPVRQQHSMPGIIKHHGDNVLRNPSTDSKTIEVIHEDLERTRRYLGIKDFFKEFLHFSFKDLYRIRKGCFKVSVLGFSYVGILRTYCRWQHRSRISTQPPGEAPRWRHGPRTSTCLLTTTWTMDIISMTLGGNMDHGQQHGSWTTAPDHTDVDIACQQHGSWTPAWPLSGGITDRGHQHGLWRQHGPWRS
ncbi:hypothetical protein STEG23_003393 [Scotinomys teguina]